KTKTKIPRQAPVHPVLAAMLAEWKLATSPKADDLIVPPWDKAWKVTRDRKLDLAAVGIRYRRGHDLRRTMISLAREDGARADLLEIVTHGAKAGDMISLYSTFPWRVLCEQVGTLKIAR